MKAFECSKVSDQRTSMNVQVNKSDYQSPAVKGASSPKNVDEQRKQLVKVESQLAGQLSRRFLALVMSVVFLLSVECCDWFGGLD